LKRRITKIDEEDDRGDVDDFSTDLKPSYTEGEVNDLD